jgi:hypothetical protein
MSVADSPDKSRRSPAYPYLSVDEAIEKARVVYQHEKRNAAPADAIVTHWGYKPTTSNGRMCVAALKKYGLMEEAGSANNRLLRLSRLALDILLLDEKEHYQQRLKAIQESALMPKIHSELWQRWGAELPSTPSMRAYLIRERDFNDSYADQFIKQYRRTISFARLDTEGTIGAEDEYDEDQPQTPEASMQPAPPNPPAAVAPAHPGNTTQVGTFPALSSATGTEYPVPVKDGVYFYVRLPNQTPLKKTHFEQFRKFMAFLESSLATDEDGGSPSDTTPAADSQ